MKKVLFALSFLLAARLVAVSPVPFNEAVNFTTTVAGSITSTLTIQGESTVTVSNNVSGGPQESTITTVWLRPGKTYPMTMAGGVSTGTGAYKLSFTAPQGYAVYIDDLPADLFTDSTVTGTYSDDHTLEIRPLGASGGGMWGSFSGVSIGEAVAWQVGLGDLRTGRSAGGIQFRELDLTNSPASRARLFYTVPTNVSQILVIKDGSPAINLRQIVTPIGFTDLVDVTGGYEIRFYSWGQVSGGGSGSPYTFSGSPWKIIKVESTSTNQLKITETQGSAVRVSQLTGTSAVATGGTITTSGSYNIHTFNSSGTLSVTGDIASADYLVLGGGGGGGRWYSGGGGGGFPRIFTGQSLAGGTYSVVVGAGGAAGTYPFGAAGANGGNSTFNGITAPGGGGGNGQQGGPANGVAGGCGGGGGGEGGGGYGGTGSYGGNGGNGIYAGSGKGGGGGGGAGGNGADSPATLVAGNGGPGISSSISGTSVTYGGGGGGSSDTPGSGGSGGGGYGATDYAAAQNGAANLGGGGGGGSYPQAAGNGGSGVVIIKYAVWSGGTHTWTLQEGDGSTWLRTTKHDSTIPTSGQRDDVVVVRTGGTSGTIVAKTKYHYVTKAWGEELDSVIADPDTAALTTTYTYYETAPTSGADEYTGNYRRVKSMTEPTGNWTAYHYYNDFAKRGQLHYEFHPYLSAPTSAPTIDTDSQADTAAAASNNGRIVHLGYDYDWTGRYRALVSRQVKINNVLTAKTTRDQDFDYSTTSPRNRYTQNDFSDATYSPQTSVQNWREDVGDGDFVGYPCVLVTPNIAQISTSVSRGTFNDSTKVFTVGSGGDHWRELEFHGSYSSDATYAPNGAPVQISAFDGQSCDAVWLIPYQSTVDVSIRIQTGLLYRTATYVYTGGSSFSLVTSEDFTYDGYGQLTQRLANNGAMTTYSYTDGRLTSTVDPTGTETQYTYDAIGRVATSVKKGASSSGSYAAQGDIATTYTYDGAGHVTQTVTSGSSLSLTSTAAYDLAGRLTSSVAPGSYTTGYGYTSNGRIVTTTLPGGATQISETYYDGQPKSLTGTGVVAQYTGFTVNSSPGTVTQQVNFGTSTSTALVKTTTDWLGRVITEVKPGWNGSDVTRTWTFDTYYGYLNKVSQPGLADTLYLYDTMGVLRREGLDVGANGTLDLSSSDRITDHAWQFFTSSSNWWRRETTSTYATTSNSTATQVAKVETQLSGLATNRLSLKNTYDIFGNVTSQFVDVDRSGKKATSTTDVPDSTTDAVQIAYNGLQMSAQDTAGITTTYGYDALGRQTTSVNPRTGTTTTAYVSGTSQVYTVTDPASVAQATYAYDSAGRVSSVKDALNKYTYSTYTDRNEKYRVWGDNTYPVEYAYDNWGHQVTMKTYRGGTGWTGSTWPGSPGTADTTTWAFHEPTGLLSSKTDDAGKVVSYTYTQAGQIATRLWARILTGATHLTTTYGYSSTTGELTSVDYNDSTTDLAYTYNRLGNQATVTDATGTRTLNYALSGTLELQSEDLPSYFGSRRVTYGYATSGVIGRPNALQLGTSGSPTADQSITYGYDTYGRFNSLAGGGTTLGYAYTSNSNLLASISDSSSGWAQSRTYLSNRDLPHVIETKVSTTSKAKFDYDPSNDGSGYDNLGRRLKVAKTGEVYSRYGNGTQGLDTTWGYDDRSQVTSEVTKLGGSATVLTGRDDAYAWDTMGNRASSSGTTHNSNAANYTTNSLNQYTQRTVPGYFDVAGAAGSGTTVTVNGSSSGVVRHGEYFFQGHALTNTSAPVYSSLTVSDGTTPFSLPAFLALTPEAFTYDDDGNQLTDGRWSYTYDAENHLVAMETASAAYGAGAPRQKLQFTYDYLGRRVDKLVSNWNSGGSVWDPFTEERFVYK